MGRNNWYKVVENVEILDVAAEGMSIARIENMVIFLPYVVPGDIVDVQIIRKRRNFLEGRVIKIVKFSEKRAAPFCNHFGICGGCKWQNLPYEKQLYFKQKQVIDQFERIGKIKIERISPIIPSENTTYYRNKLEFTFSNKRWLFDGESELPNESDYWGVGFHIPGRFDKVIDLKECFLQPEPSNRIRIAIGGFCKINQIPFFDLKKQEGYMRNLIIRNTLDGQVMVIICFFYENSDWQDKILMFVSEQFPEITSLYYAINSKHNDSLDGIDPILYKGKEFLKEQLGKLNFKISPKSFFQTNSRQTKVLYEKVLEFADLKGNEIVYDLFSGTGTIGLFLAKFARQVIGIEYVADAVKDARENAIINGITNAVFYTGDTKEIFTSAFIKNNGTPDVLILDPPRSGIHKDVIELLQNIKPHSIIYISCNPATQARDIDLLSSFYLVDKCQPVDMFPHTHHVENIVKLTVI